MNEQRKEVSIVLPKELREASARALALCELFISKLLDESEFPVSVRVDTENSAVHSNNANVKEVINVLLKTKRLPMFYEQLKALLVDGEHLSCIQCGSERDFHIKEIKPFPDFEWIIESK
ncbi:TPA: hypothetical protein RQK74_001463 [Vibrio vulnificus]|nr:hypothetical protein [Vibrio vulnificus]